MGKNRIIKNAILAVIMAVLLLCVCSCSLKKLSLRVQVNRYCQDKYGITSEVTDIKRNVGLWGVTGSYEIKANDGVKEFDVLVTKDGEITDNYEADLIDEALRDWVNSYEPGAAYVHLMFGMYGADEKFTGDIVSFLKAHGEMNRYTFAYVDHSFKTKDDALFLSELYDNDLIYDCFLLNCPDAESAKIVYDKFSPANIEVEYYSPYITDSLVIDYNGEAEYNSHELENVDGISFCWLEYPNYVYIDEPTCSVKLSDDNSLSKICPTYEVDAVMDEDDRRVMVVFIPLDMIEGDLKISFTDSMGLQRFVVSNADFGTNGITYYSYGVFGDYAVAVINIHSGTNYFAVDKPA